MPTGSNRVPPNRTPVRIPHGRGREKETQGKQEEQEETDDEDGKGEKRRSNELEEGGRERVVRR